MKKTKKDDLEYLPDAIMYIFTEKVLAYRHNRKRLLKISQLSKYCKPFTCLSPFCILYVSIAKFKVWHKKELIKYATVNLSCY